MNKTGSLAIFVVSVIVLAAEPVQAEIRTWTDTSGAYKVEAELVDENEGTERLKRSDGRIVSLPLDRLSLAASSRPPSGPSGVSAADCAKPAAIAST